MKRMVLVLLVAAAVTLSGCSKCQKMASCKECQMLSHNVYFTLNDASDEKVTELINECHTYLKKHPGVMFFAAGQLSPEQDRRVNIRNFHVSLMVVFNSVESHDLYQTAPDHLTFIERNKDNWKEVRVFDSLVN
jgi:uncharacterized protein YceK